MGINSISRGKVLWIVALLVASLVVVGCAGIKPYEPQNNREEGPEKGLFTGSKGEFVILRKAEETKNGSENTKSPGEPESAVQPEPASDERGNVDRPLGDTP
jgi:hypothetical protein